jgi:hypothetical protein
LGFLDFINRNFYKFNWIGRQQKQGDSTSIKPLPSVENVKQGERSISTTVDCYVSGEYVTKDGKTFKIRQRYSIAIKYSRSTLNEVMQRLRNAIQSEFTATYSGDGFQISDVFVPLLTAPTAYQTVEFYRGSKYWRLLLKRNVEEVKFEEDVPYRAKKLIRRYGLRKNI